ncbi:MAG: hydrogenase iron-sulfur subunit [Planctomycetota bacterium]|nr:hydrogenase iron-sulfur subunit [Planctomycetota bacterium]
MSGNFQPKIVGFLCNWCCYAGDDLAEAPRFHHPPNLRAVRVMCSGRVDPTFVLEAFANGADGVLIGACHLGECHFQEGNYATVRRFPILQRLLRQFGIEDERVRLEWVSTAEGERFENVVADMTEKVKALGPVKCTV